jgi:L-fuconolactonase
MGIVDTHAHLISDDPIAYPPACASIERSNVPSPLRAEDLLASMDRAGVERALLVQRGSIYGFDNRYVCDSAARYPHRLAAVCAIDATADDAAKMVRHWVTERGAAGIRLMELTRGSDLSWLGAAGACPVWRAADSLGVPVCVHFFPWNRLAGLRALRELLSGLPGVRVVIDHFSNMNVQSGPPDFGVDEPLAELARFRGVHVKFTTIPLGRLDSSGVDPAPIIARVVALFGAERVMWGSDIGQSPGAYEHMVELARGAVRALTAAQQDCLLSRSALSVYRSAWS